MGFAIGMTGAAKAFPVANCTPAAVGRVKVFVISETWTRTTDGLLIAIEQL